MNWQTAVIWCLINELLIFSPHPLLISWFIDNCGTSDFFPIHLDCFVCFHIWLICNNNQWQIFILYDIDSEFINIMPFFISEPWNYAVCSRWLTKSFFVGSKEFNEISIDFARFNFPNNCDKFFKESKRNQEKIFTTDGELSIYLSG